MINNTIYLEVFDISGRYYNVLQTGMNKSTNPLQHVPLFAIFNTNGIVHTSRLLNRCTIYCFNVFISYAGIHK